MRTALAAASLVLLSGCASAFAPLLKPEVSSEAAALTPGAYTLDPTHASVLFKIDHLGYSQYVGRFERWDATLDFDADDPSSARLDAIVDMTSLDIANDEFAETLMGPDWFDSETHPQAIFRSTEITVTGDNTGTATGDLTLNGVTAPATFDITFNGGGQDALRRAYVVGFSATGEIDRTVFGVDRFSGLITDTVSLEIEAEFLAE